MTRLVWLASYPKSGNTWFRMLAHALAQGPQRPLNINRLPVEAGIASARYPFDYLTLIESKMLTHEEADRLRPDVYAAIARGEFRDPVTPVDAPLPDPYFLKVHDAYVRNQSNQPLFAGAEAAVLVVRDPRAIAPSFAAHEGCSIDEAIQRMARARFEVSAAYEGRPSQLRQRLLDWSAHTASWLEQSDVPVHRVRYEDLKADTARVLRAAMRFAGRDVSVEAAAEAARAADFSALQAQEREKGFVERPPEQPRRSAFFRRGETEGWRAELTAAQIARIEVAHGEMMRRLGYALSSEPPPA